MKHRFIRALENFLPERLQRSRQPDDAPAALDTLYDADFFRNVIETHSGFAARPMANSIMRDLAPHSVLDVGCGGGHLLEALRDRGCEIFGLEFAPEGLEACRRRRIPVARVDLERDSFTAPRLYDVVCSIEVAEHLPEHAADHFVNLLATASDCLVFSAATPGQGGTGHLNEQPHSYWINKLAEHGLALDEALSAAWSSEWETAGLQPWFWRNIMVFRRARTPGSANPSNAQG
ncbi:MAG: class I SAM-dependent methyltransferase [Bryobacterales bacterium]|nr:class I SAM-dependent methyltransferase [Bryobacterales bacterium]